MASEYGFPMDTEYFAGKEREVAHLPDMIEQLEKDYDIERFILAADRGNYSGNVIHEVEEDGDYYIIGIPVRLADGKFRYWAANPDGYTFFRYRRIGKEEDGFKEKSRIVDKEIHYKEDGKEKKEKDY